MHAERSTQCLFAVHRLLCRVSSRVCGTETCAIAQIPNLASLVRI
jgi:hypothetical protein